MMEPITFHSLGNYSTLVLNRSRLQPPQHDHLNWGPPTLTSTVNRRSQGITFRLTSG